MTDFGIIDCMDEERLCCGWSYDFRKKICEILALFVLAVQEWKGCFLTQMKVELSIVGDLS